MADKVNIKFDVTQGINKIVKALDESVQKDAMEKCGEMLKDHATKYIPTRTGTLANSGVVKTGVNKHSGWVKLTYSDTPNIKYAMYQYNGIIWDFNHAKFRKDGSYVWRSPKGAKKVPSPEGRPLGVPRTVTCKNGKVLHIDGYTNPLSQPKWLEYLRTEPTAWYPLRFQMWTMIRDNFRSKMKK